MLRLMDLFPPHMFTPHPHANPTHGFVSCHDLVTWHSEVLMKVQQAQMGVHVKSATNIFRERS